MVEQIIDKETGVGLKTLSCLRTVLESFSTTNGEFNGNYDSLILANALDFYIKSEGRINLVNDKKITSSKYS